jgi:hypothetical protein
MELRVPIVELSVLLGGDLSGLDAGQLRQRLVDFYGFLPEQTDLAIDGEAVILRWPEASASNKAEAERLAAKAAHRAKRGEHAKARDIFKAALELDPSLTDARRGLGAGVGALTGTL